MTQEESLALPWRRRFEHIIDRFAFGNRARFGRDIGASPQAVHSLLRGTVPGGARLSAIAKAYARLNTSFLLTDIRPLLLDTPPNSAFNRGALAAPGDIERAVQEIRSRYSGE